MSALLIVLIVIGLFAFGIVGWAISTYNRFVALRQKVDESWSGIDVQLKLRHDLVPNLVETVKGYASHEKETLERVITARNAAVAAGGGSAGEAVAAEGLLTGALRQLFALSEAYPDLKADQNFQQLQQELSQIEEKIAVARRIYNGMVREFNTGIQQFPANIIAGIGGFRARDYFELDDPSERSAPQVSFSS